MLLILNYEKWSYQKLKELNTLENVTFQLPNGTYVPEHFHVTEVVNYQKFHWLVER
jgi:chemotaxis signal transduction protein